MNFRKRKSLPVPVTRKGSVRCLESFLTMPSVMSPQTGKLFFPFHRPKRTFLSASKTTDPVFRILPRLLFSGVFTGQILPEITGSILVWDCVLRMRSFHFIKEQSLYWIPRAVVLLFRFLCRWHNTVIFCNIKTGTNIRPPRIFVPVF